MKQGGNASVRTVDERWRLVVTGLDTVILMVIATAQDLISHNYSSPPEAQRGFLVNKYFKYKHILPTHRYHPSGELANYRRKK